MFSGANHFITLVENPKLCSVYGFTEKEIRDTYGPHIRHRAVEFRQSIADDSALAASAGESDAALIDGVVGKMIEWYNGYKWHEYQVDRVLNPWCVLRARPTCVFRFVCALNCQLVLDRSVISYLKSRLFNCHWGRSGLSANLIRTIGLHAVDIFNGFEMTQEKLNTPISASEFRTNWQQLAFQAISINFLRGGLKPSTAHPALFLLRRAATRPSNAWFRALISCCLVLRTARFPRFSATRRSRFCWAARRRKN